MMVMVIDTGVAEASSDARGGNVWNVPLPVAIRSADTEVDEIDKGGVGSEVEDCGEEEEKTDEEDWVEGSGENERDVLVLASLQNCWARLSAFARSPAHCELTQLVMSVAKVVALFGQLIRRHAV